MSPGHHRRRFTTPSCDLPSTANDDPFAPGRSRHGEHALLISLEVSRMKSKSLGRKFIPRLQPLDERALPSSSQPFVEYHCTVTIQGGRGDNTITVSDDGTNNPGALLVQIDGQTYQSQ